MESRPREIILALLFRNKERGEELGPPLWAALREVGTFYNADEKRAEFLRAFLAPEIPAPFREESEWMELGTGRGSRPRRGMIGSGGACGAGSGGRATHGS